MISSEKMLTKTFPVFYGFLKTHVKDCAQKP